MKTTKSLVAIARAGRELEKKNKKSPTAEEFSHVLAAVPLPLHRPAEVIAIAKEAPKKETPRHPAPALGVNGNAAPVVHAAAPREAAPAAPAAFVAQLPEDPGLRVTVAPTAAAITIQTPDQGDLSLYLRVRQGTAELRVEGAAAPQVERHTDELRMVLATEGITLRHVEVTAPTEMQNTASFSSERDQHAPPEPFERPDPDAPPASRQAPSSSSTPRPEAGLHVRA